MPGAPLEFEPPIHVHDLLIPLDDELMELELLDEIELLLLEALELLALVELMELELLTLLELEKELLDDELTELELLLETLELLNALLDEKFVPDELDPPPHALTNAPIAASVKVRTTVCRTGA